MNILIFNWRDPFNPKAGGAEIVTLEHAKYWAKMGSRVTWFASSFPTSCNEEIVEGVKIVRSGGSLGVYLRAPIFYFKNRRETDVVVDEIHGIPFFTPLFVRKPIVAFIHEVAGEIWDYMYPFPINLFGKWLETLYFKLYRSVKFWTDAPSTIPELVDKGIPKKNCIAIPCPVNNLPIASTPIKYKNPTFIFVSRLVKMKGIESVLEAFTLIHERYSDAQLLIVGGGDAIYTEELKEKVRKGRLDDVVKFEGFVPQERKLELMSKSHVLLHASVKEGWGLVVIEAASQMTPAVVYNVPGLKDSVKHQSTGIITSENTPVYMAKGAIALIEDKGLYVKMQKEALSWAKSLKWSEVSKVSYNLLKSL